MKEAHLSCPVYTMDPPVSKLCFYPNKQCDEAKGVPMRLEETDTFRFPRPGFDACGRVSKRRWERMMAGPPIWNQPICVECGFLLPSSPTGADG